MELFRDTIIQGDCLTELCKLPSELVDCVFTSPPYWGLRDYGVSGQIGLEIQPTEYINKIVEIFREIKRVLKSTGTVFLNIGDTFFGGNLGLGQPDNWKSLSTTNIEGYGHKSPEMLAFIEQRNKLKSNWLRPKQKMLIPERVAIAMQDDGWLLRNSIIWHKINHMPESVTDRLTRSYETVFFFTKSEKYYFDLNSVRKQPISNCGSGIRKISKTQKFSSTSCFNGGDTSYNSLGSNPGDVWSLTSEPYKEAHFAVFPQKLVRRGLSCGCPKEGLVLDPFAGSGTTLYVARKMALHYLGIELNPKYVELAKKRLNTIPDRLESFLVSPHLLACDKLKETQK
jgi:DNA modification methylase